LGAPILLLLLGSTLYLKHAKGRLLECPPKTLDLQKTFCHCDLCVHDRTRRRPDADVVREHDKLDVQNAALAHSADVDPASVLVVPVESRLRPVNLVVDMDRLLGRGRTCELLWLAGVRLENLDDLLRRRRRSPGKADGNSLGVAVEDRYAVAVSRDLERRVRMEVERILSRLHEAAEDLGRLPLDLLLFARDIRNDVVEDVERWHAGIASSRDSLHRSDEDALERTKGKFEGLERDDYCRRRAVCVRDDVSLLQRRLLLKLLVPNDVEMVRVYKRNDERDQRIPTEVFGIGKDDELCSSKRRLYQRRRVS
jgi:hypothetical protein